ncbi:MAG: hypothetical protein ACE5RJ_01340 [Nitrosopumilaceae archaeon]
MSNQTLKEDGFFLSYRALDSMINPIDVLKNGFELLKHRFENTMDSYALAEFERIERSIEQLTERVEFLRDEYQLEETKSRLFK